MPFLIALIFFVLVWLTYLTNKQKRQKRIMNDLERRNKIYLRELIKLGYEQEEAKKTKEG